MLENSDTARKSCSKCRASKPVTEFYGNSENKDGKNNYCKACAAAQHQTWRRKNTVALLLMSAKNRAKKVGKEFSLTADDIIVPAFCPVLGIPLRKAEGRSDDNSPSLDRFDSSKGYVSGNVHVISWRANRLKNESTVDDLLKIAAWMQAQ